MKKLKVKFTGAIIAFSLSALAVASLVVDPEPIDKGCYQFCKDTKTKAACNICCDSKQAGCYGDKAKAKCKEFCDANKN